MLPLLQRGGRQLLPPRALPTAGARKLTRLPITRSSPCSLSLPAYHLSALPDHGASVKEVPGGRGRGGERRRKLLSWSHGY